MDNRLVLTVLFVTLSWMSFAHTTAATNMTTAETNMTTAATNMTTAETNMTTAETNMTTVATNMTTAATNMTTAATNMTTAATNMTTAASNMTTVATNMTTAATNMTTAATNMTTAATNMTTVATNMTTAATNMTTAATNMTTAATNMTTAATNNTTAAANMTTAATNMTTAATNMTTAAANNTTAAPTTGPPLMTNITVETLETPVSRAGCRSQKLCGTDPADCDPSISSSCLFGSLKQRDNSRDLEFEISGDSAGYVACTLSRDSTLGGNDATYVCANNNGIVQFFGALLNNGQLTETTLNVNSVKGRVNGSRIQCTFAATPPSSATATLSRGRAGRAQDNFAVGISTGSFTNGTLGNPTPRFLSDVLDVSNPNATTTNTLTASTTMSPNTTSHGITLRQSLTQAVLMIVGVLSLATL